MKKMLSLILALVLVVSLVPATAQAASHEVRMEQNAIPVEGAETQGNTYPITFVQNKGGTITCDVTEYEAYDYVYFTIKADPGYYVDVVELEYEYWMQHAQFDFMGFDHYRLKTSDGKSKVTVTFTKLSGPDHKINVKADGNCTWKLDRTSAQHHETFYLDVTADKYYSASVYALTADGKEEVETYDRGGYPNYQYEFHMPDKDVQIVIETTKGSPYSIKASTFNDGGTVSLSTDRACYGDIVQLTILPKPGYRPLYIIPNGGPGIEETVISYAGSNIWNVTMPNNALTLLVSFEQSDNPFMDVSNDTFYYDSVMWAVKNGVTSGTDLSHFNPTGECLRAHVVTFLWRAAGCPEPTSAENPFVDVSESDFFHKAVLWAVENGITNGVDATHFGPTVPCNRAQVVTFLYRAMQSPAVGTTACPFTDVVAGQWYEPAVLWAVENGITNGLSADTFGVDTTCNRAQVVTFLYRTYVN